METTIIIATRAQFQLQTQALETLAAHISETQSNSKIVPTLNPIKWVVGHLLNTRLVLLNILTKMPMDTEFAALFGKGSLGNIEAHYPSFAEILERWRTTAILLQDTLAQLSEATLLSKAPFQTSIPDSTLLGLVAYMAHHEAYHLGQLSILKKML